MHAESPDDDRHTKDKCIRCKLNVSLCKVLVSAIFNLSLTVTHFYLVPLKYEHNQINKFNIYRINLFQGIFFIKSPNKTRIEAVCLVKLKNAKFKVSKKI